jgi:ubiquinol-cytochrome c reductase iron-sulfur subunit
LEATYFGAASNEQLETAMGSDTTSANSASLEKTRRDFLYVATASVGAVGAAATLIPLIDQMSPDAATITAGAPVEFDLS